MSIVVAPGTHPVPVNSRTGLNRVLVEVVIALVVAVLAGIALMAGASASEAAVGDVISVEAEDFTAGAYNDSQPGNQGNSDYRAGQDIDVWRAYGDAGNFVIGTTRDGEWAEYAVTVEDAGSYRFNLRLASGRPEPGSIAVAVDGATVGTLDFENSGSWWTWVTPDLGTAELTAGSHSVRITWSGEANINFDRFTLTHVAAAGCPALTAQAEDGAITGSMIVGSGAGANGGKYLTTRSGDGAPRPNVSYADLCVTVPTAGRYRLDGIVQNPNNRDDSFWVSIDGGGAALWDTRISNGWKVDSVRARSIANPAVWALDAGQHTIRVSAREDGAKLDQLALIATNLPATDLGNGPIDPTTTPRPAITPDPIVTPGPAITPDPIVTPGPAITPDPIVTPGPYVADSRQRPYGVAPIVIPGRVDAENYDRGGSSIAWNDASEANDGNANFRTSEGVDVGHAVDPFGRFVGWLEDGDWTEYTIVADDAVEDRMLTLFSRVASAATRPGSMLVSINGTPMATVDVPATGGWQNWQTVSFGGFSLPPGPHTLRLTAIDGARFNINFVRFDLALGAASYREHEAPGLIQLEDFDFGNRRVGYDDADTENRGGKYRWEAVDLYESDDSDGSFYVGDTGNGEWLNYTFTADEAGTYDLHLRAASANETTQPVDLLVDGQPVGIENFDSTAWTTKTVGPITLGDGEHVLRVATPAGGVNLNWVYITRSGEGFTPPTALSGTVRVAPEDDLGMLSVLSAPGTTFELLPGIHSYDHVFPKDGQKFIGVGALGAARMVGDQVRSPAFGGTADNVEIRNLDISDYGTGLFIGTISGRNNDDFGDFGSNWIVEGNRIHNGNSVGVNLAPGMQVLNNEIYENGQIGISGVGRDITRLPDVLVEGNEIHHNGPEAVGMAPFNFHEGGMKTTFSDRLVVRNNIFHDNYGVALYCDLHCDDVLYENNEMSNNIGPNHGGGVFYEWSTNGTIRNNTIDSRSATPARDVIIGIRVGESQDVDIVDNTLTMGSASALDLRSCCATDDDPSFERVPSARITFRNNTVTSTSAGTRIRTISDQAALTGNIYNNGSGQVRFYRGSSQRTWAQWQADGQDRSGQFN